jgi:hypothetical protein
MPKGIEYRQGLCVIVVFRTQGQTQGSMLQQCTNKTLTIGPFGNTFETDEVSPEVEVWEVARLGCLQPSWDTNL